MFNVWNHKMKTAFLNDSICSSIEMVHLYYICDIKSNQGTVQSHWKQTDKLRVCSLHTY